MLHRTEGIVLRTTPFGEADLIVSFLTCDFGFLKAFAKSPLKTKSKFGSSLEPLTHSRITFWGKEDVSLPRLTQSDIIYSFQSIRDSLKCVLKVSEILELTVHFIPEREVNKRVYFLLVNTLHHIEANCDSNMILLHYKVKLLKFLGYAPKLDACGRCGKKGYSFYVSQGSILCEDCAKEAVSPIRITRGVMDLYSVLLTWDISKIPRIKPSSPLLSELSDVIDTHIKYILTKPLKSQEFIHSLTQSLLFNW